MLRKVKLYGDLAKQVGHKELEAEVSNAAQAVRFLVTNWPFLEKYMADKYYKVTSENWEITEDELHFPTGSSDIKIIPVIAGAGGNTGRILLGAALIGASFIFPGAGMFGTHGLIASGAAGTAATVGVSTAGVLTAVGTMTSVRRASMVLSGVSNMISPVPTVSESEQDPRRSFSFSGIQNTSRAGVAVPVIYGKVMTGSVVISAAIDTVQVEA